MVALGSFRSFIMLLELSRTVGCARSGSDRFHPDLRTYPFLNGPFSDRNWLENFGLDRIRSDSLEKGSD